MSGDSAPDHTRGEEPPFRTELVVFDKQEQRVLVWVREDPAAFRCGLALPQSDFHVTLKKKSGVSHPDQKGELPVSVVLLTDRAGRLGRWRMLGLFLFAAVHAEFRRYSAFRPGRSRSQALVNLEHYPSDLFVGVYVGAPSQRNSLPDVLALPGGLVHVDASPESLVAVQVSDKGPSTR